MPKLLPEDWDVVVSVIGRVATDVWDEVRLGAHIREACVTTSGKQRMLSEAQVERVMLAIAYHFGYDMTDQSYTPDEYLDSLHWFIGHTHNDLVKSLRLFVVEEHPEEALHDYGKARHVSVTP